MRANLAEEFGELRANAARATSLLKAMSNPTRLMLLCHLADGEKSVGALVDAVGVSQSGLSQHLAVLRRASVLSTRRAGQTIYYSIASSEATAIMATLYDVFCAKAKRGGATPARLKLVKRATA